VGSTERVGEDPSGDQSSEWRHKPGAEQRADGRGANHGFSESQTLHPNPCDLHDGAHDDRDATDAVRLPSRLHLQRTIKHRLASAA